MCRTELVWLETPAPSPSQETLRRPPFYRSWPISGTRANTCKYKLTLYALLLTRCSVWQSIIQGLGDIRSIFSEGDQELADGLRVFHRSVVTPAAEFVGWEFAENEDFLTGQLRALLISSAGLAGHEE